MPEISLMGGGPFTSTLNTVGTGPDVTCGVNDVKAASWTELYSAAQNLYGAQWVNIRFHRPVSSGSYLFDFALGAAGAEQIFINNLHFRLSQTGCDAAVNYLFPLLIPRGVRIAARGQYEASGTVSCYVIMHLIQAPISNPSPLNRCESNGIVTATTRSTIMADPGATAGVKGAWTQLVASTAFAYRWVCVNITCEDIAYFAGTGHFIDIGLGGAGVEQVIIPDLTAYGGTNDNCPRPQNYCFPCSIPAGSRLSARNSCDTTRTGDRIASVALYGFA